MLKYIALLVTVVVVNNAISITPAVPDYVYYSFIAFALLPGINSEIRKINGYLVLLIIAAIISILTNEIPGYFKAPERLIIFTIVLLLISPLVTTSKLIQMRLHVFRFINIALIVIVFISILGRFTGLFPGIGRGGIFRGITVHSMMLGPISAMVILILIFAFYKYRFKRFYKNIFIVILAFSFIALLLASSRAAIAGAVFSLIMFYYTYYRNRLGKLVGVLIMFMLILMATSSVWIGYTERIQQKNINNEQNGSLISSRETLWDNRIAEFKSSPITGIGFATLHEGSSDKRTGVIEPGTSWLAVFSMTGLLGGIPFILLIVSHFNKLWKSNLISLETSLLMAMLGFFVIHWFAEGYIFAAGAFLFFYSWLLIGVIDIHASGIEIKII